MGYQRRDGEDCRHEGVWLVRVCKREGSCSILPSWLSFAHRRPVQVQTLKTAIEASRVLLRVDDVVKATRKDREQGGGGGGGAPPPEEMVEG